MKKLSLFKSERGQSFVELAFIVPFLLLVLLGAVEVVIAGRTYLALLEASVVSSRLGSSGISFYDNTEILTLTNQVLSQEGLTSSDLVDVIITRADLVGGTTVENYQVENMLGSGRPTQLTEAYLQSQMDAGDLSVHVIGVEVVFDHHLLFAGSNFLPDPLVLKAFTLNAIP